MRYEVLFRQHPEVYRRRRLFLFAMLTQDVRGIAVREAKERTNGRNGYLV